MDAEKDITVWYSVPSALIQLVEHGQWNGTTTTICAGCCSQARYFPSNICAGWECSRFRTLLTAICTDLPQTNVCTYYHVQSSDVAPERRRSRCR